MLPLLGILGVALRLIQIPRIGGEWEGGFASKIIMSFLFFHDIISLVRPDYHHGKILLQLLSDQRPNFVNSENNEDKPSPSRLPASLHRFFLPLR